MEYGGDIVWDWMAVSGTGSFKLFDDATHIGSNRMNSEVYSNTLSGSLQRNA